MWPNSHSISQVGREIQVTGRIKKSCKYNTLGSRMQQVKEAKSTTKLHVAWNEGTRERNSHPASPGGRQAIFGLERVYSISEAFRACHGCQRAGRWTSISTNRHSVMCTIKGAVVRDARVGREDELSTTNKRVQEIHGGSRPWRVDLTLRSSVGIHTYIDIVLKDHRRPSRNTSDFQPHQLISQNGPRSRLPVNNRLPQSRQSHHPRTKEARHERCRLHRALQPQARPNGCAGVAEAQRHHVQSCRPALSIHVVSFETRTLSLDVFPHGRHIASNAIEQS